MNWDYRDREPISRTRIVPLTPAQVAAFHEQLRLEDERAQILRAKQAQIAARMKALRVSRIADAYARAKVRRAIRKAIKPLVVHVTPDMVSTSKSQPGIDIKQSSGVDIRVKGVPAQIPLPLEAA